MPAAPAAPSAAVLVVDTARLLDESPAGVAGAAALQAKYDEARARFEKLRDKGTTTQGKRQAEEAAAAFERDAFADLERERAALAKQVMDAAFSAVQAVMQERGASVVVDARATVAFAAAVDVTDLVLQRLKG